MTGMTAAVVGAMSSSDVLAIVVILLLFAIFWASLRIIRKEKELAKKVVPAVVLKKTKK